MCSASGQRRGPRSSTAGSIAPFAVVAYRLLETSHPPVYYFPPEDILPGVLVPTPRSSFCEFKGAARYFIGTAGGRRAEDAAWSYPDPSPAFAVIRDHVAFYPGRMDACTVDGKVVVPQPGGDLHLQADAALVLRPSSALAHLATLSHSAAGIAVGLLELFACAGREAFLTAGEGALAYEDFWFNAKLRSWPDLHSVTAVAARGQRFIW